MSEIDLNALGKLMGGYAWWAEEDIILTWKKNMVRLRPEGDTLLWIDVVGEDAISDLVLKTPSWLLANGFTRDAVVVCIPAGEKWVRAIGFEESEDQPGRYESSHESGSRVDEYAKWKRGEAEEPDWHKMLEENNGN